MQKTLYVGLDVHKATLSITVAEEGRDGPVRFIGTIPNTPTDVAKLARRLGKEGDRLEFCYEAGGCGYGIYRQLTALGHGCTVAAPTLIARKPGDRIKTDRRDFRNWLCSTARAISRRCGYPTRFTRQCVTSFAHGSMRSCS